jgi:hypothetical protein
MNTRQRFVFVTAGALSASALACSSTTSNARPVAPLAPASAPAEEPVGVTHTTSALTDPEHPVGTPWAIADSPRPEPASSRATLDVWPSRYPDASRALRAWFHDHPAAAAKLAEWDAKHAERVHTLILWAVTHPYEDVRLFTMARPGWTEYTPDDPEVHAALQEFVLWCRRSPPAASELATHPQAIDRLFERGGP